MATKNSTPNDPAAIGADAKGTMIEVESVPVEGTDADEFKIVRPQEGAGLFARAAIEAFGSFGLVFVILSTALYSSVTGLSVLGSALAAGLVLVGLISALGHISGGHFNPAVSLAAALTGRLGWLDMALYWVSQVVGGVLAAAIVYVTIPGTLATLLGYADTRTFFATAANGWDANSPLSILSTAQVTFDIKAALILELAATALFVAVVLGVAHRKTPSGVGPFAIGATYAAALLVTGMVTGGGLNPARSTAAALFSGSGALGQLWLFWLAPLAGAAIAALVYVAFARSHHDDDVLEVLDDEDEDEDDEIRL